MADTTTGPFDTAALESDLAGRSARSGVATFAGQGASFVISLGVTAVLARLLVPADFGIFAMVGPLRSFAEVFAYGGLSHATIQRAQLSHPQVSTLFWINVALGLVLCLLMAGAGPLAARLYGQPEVAAVTALLATTLAISGLGVQHAALLRRQMRFGTLASIHITSLVAGAAAGVTMAYLTRSYWALVVQQLVMSGVNTLLYWAFVRWLPGRPRRRTGVRPLLTFGANVTMTGFLNYAVRNADNVLIGWLWGPASLGLYTKAYALLMLPISQINQPMGSVAVPALSRLQADPRRFRSFYRTAMSLMVSVGMPIVAFSLAQTEDLVLLVLGSQWSGVVPLFRALGLAAFLGTFNVASGWAVLPLGQADRMLRASAFGAVVTLLAFGIGVRWGAVGVAVAFSVSELVKRPVQLVYTYRLSPIRLSDLWSALWRPALGSVAASLAVISARHLWAELPLPARLGVAGSVFGASYLLVLALVPGGRELLSRLITTAHLVRAER